MQTWLRFVHALVLGLPAFSVMYGNVTALQYTGNNWNLEMLWHAGWIRGKCLAEAVRLGTIGDRLWYVDSLEGCHPDGWDESSSGALFVAC